MHACIHTCTFIHIHSCMFPYIHIACTCIQQICIHAFMHMYICTDMYIHTYVCLLVFTYTQTCIHRFMHGSQRYTDNQTLSACLCTNIHTWLHIFIHIYIQTHAYPHAFLVIYIYTWLIHRHCPTPGTPDTGNIFQDLDTFRRGVTLHLFFSESN